MGMSCSQTRGLSSTLAGEQSNETHIHSSWDQYWFAVLHLQALYLMFHPGAGDMRLLVQMVRKPPTYQRVLVLAVCSTASEQVP